MGITKMFWAIFAKKSRIQEKEKIIMEKIIKENTIKQKVSINPKVEEYEVVEREILPEKIICPDCGGVTLEGLEYCDKCGGELNS